MAHVQSKRGWLGGGAFVALLIVAVGWVMFIAPERSSTADFRTQAATTRQQNAALELKVKALKLQSNQIGKYVNALRAALTALPYDSGLPAFTRQLSAQAQSRGVTLSSVVVGGVTPLTGGGAATADTPTADATATTSTSPTSTSPTVAAGAATGGLFSVQVTIQSTGTLTNQLTFLSAIRTEGPRRALVDSAQVTAGAGAKTSSINSSASVTTQLTVFSAPQSPAQIKQLKNLLNGKIGN